MDVLATEADVRGRRRAPRVRLSPNPTLAILSTFTSEFLLRPFTPRHGPSHHVYGHGNCRNQEPAHG